MVSRSLDVLVHAIIVKYDICLRLFDIGHKYMYSHRSVGGELSLFARFRITCVVFVFADRDGYLPTAKRCNSSFRLCSLLCLVTCVVPSIIIATLLLKRRQKKKKKKTDVAE